MTPGRSDDDDLLDDLDEDPDPEQLSGGWGPSINPALSEEEESEEEVDPDECCRLPPAAGIVVDDELADEEVSIGGRLGYPGIRP